MAEQARDPATRGHRGRQGVSKVPCEFRHPTVANYFTVDLAVLKELSQELAELFGLTLPFLEKNAISCKTATYSTRSSRAR